MAKIEKTFNDYLIERTPLLEQSYISRDLMRDIQAGLDTSGQKKKYIKKVGDKETDETYANRIYNSVFHNITNRMIKINYTRPFGKESQITSDDPFLAGLQENFDGYKNSLTDFGKRKNKTAMYDSMAHIFCDLPENPDREYRPDDKPTAIVLENDNILGARTGKWRRAYTF